MAAGLRRTTRPSGLEDTVWRSSSSSGGPPARSSFGSCESFGCRPLSLPQMESLEFQTAFSCDTHCREIGGNLLPWEAGFSLEPVVSSESQVKEGALSQS